MTQAGAHLAAAFHRFADEIGRTAPTYGAICRGVADDPEILAMLNDAPLPQRRPVLLLAAVHHLLLGAPDEPLARHYRSIGEAINPGDPVPAFVELCQRRRAELTALIATRSTQTNDVGRASLLRLALPTRKEVRDRSVGLIDLGTSAGLNLLLHRYSFRFHDLDGGETLIPGGSPTLDCLIRGAPVDAVVPSDLPAIGFRIGVDPSPIDISDPDQARWLQACVWPDHLERLTRLRAALATAANSYQEVTRLSGSAPEHLVEAVSAVRRGDAHPVVVNTWSFTYYDEAARAEQLALLDELGGDGDLTWIFLEAPNETPELPWGEVDTATSLSVLRRVDYRSGERVETTIGIAHPHGRWLEVVAT